MYTKLSNYLKNIFKKISFKYKDNYYTLQLNKDFKYSLTGKTTVNGKFKLVMLRHDIFIVKCIGFKRLLLDTTNKKITFLNTSLFKTPIANAKFYE